MLKYNSPEDKVLIDPESVRLEGWDVWYYYHSFYAKYFRTYGVYLEFFKQMAQEYPWPGIDATLFGYKCGVYGDAEKTNYLIARGIVEEVYDEEGNVGYQVVRL
jgi:hypothetical protein